MDGNKVCFKRYNILNFENEGDSICLPFSNKRWPKWRLSGLNIKSRLIEDKRVGFRVMRLK